MYHVMRQEDNGTATELGVYRTKTQAKAAAKDAQRHDPLDREVTVWDTVRNNLSGLFPL